MRDVFDLPDLAAMDDGIANGTYEPRPGEPQPLALFTAPRVDYSLHRLRHYTGTAPEHFQNFVLFTNYQFYIDEFVRWAMRPWLTRPASTSPSWNRAMW
jgi:AMP nucleosidase